MSDEEDITGVEFETDIETESSIPLDQEWVAWLESEPVPDNVEGVESTTPGSEGPAIA